MKRTGFVTAIACVLAACGPTGGGPADRTNVASDKVIADPWSAIAWDGEDTSISTTASGLKYVILKSGPACENSPAGSDRAIVHYEGQLTDGTPFDASPPRGEPTDFPANRVIRGWTEALGLMCEGDEWMLYLPSDLAYGESGTPGGPIGPNSDLIFRVHLIAAIDEATWTAADW